MTALRQKQPRERNKGYLGALHDLPCLIGCGCSGPTEAAHIRLTAIAADIAGPRAGAGMGEKPSDQWALPICAHHHREGPQAEHVIGTRAFWRLHGIDPHRAANALFTAYPDRALMASIVLRHHLFGTFKTKGTQ